MLIEGGALSIALNFYISLTHFILIKRMIKSISFPTTLVCTLKILIIFILQLNLSALAREYGIHGPRGNMVVREFLEQENVDLGKFRNNKINKQRVRRSYLKMPGII